MKPITVFLIGFFSTTLGYIGIGWHGYYIGLLMALIIVLIEILLEGV